MKMGKERVIRLAEPSRRKMGILTILESRHSDTLDNDTENVPRSPLSEGDLLPVLPLKRVALFPSTLMPVGVSRESSTRLLEEASERETLFAVASQKHEERSNPQAEDLYEVGVVARVARLLHLPDGGLTAFVQGIHRVRLSEVHEGRHYLVGRVEEIPERMPRQMTEGLKATVDAIHDLAERLGSSGDGARVTGRVELKDVRACATFVNFVCSSLPVEAAELQSLLEIGDIEERATALLSILHRECEYAELKEKIQGETRQELSRQQREFFLRREMDKIREELSESGDEEGVDALVARAAEKQWGEATRARFDKELARLKRLSPQGPEYASQYDWLDEMLQLPWGERTKDRLDLQRARRVLDADHWGMEKVKERIVEHLAIVKLRGDMKAPILCLWGPPGVGKTSLGKSIAKAMGRKYVRMSVGGLHDEAEIRGHRRTYVGAMPGRIIKGLKEAGTDNPVFVLDEVDKVGGMSMSGDPASALLEVLDPEQNGSFHDNYLDMNYDLSGVMFIATANNVSSIPAPLLDRMELIEVGGYLLEEKVEIARRHLLPAQLAKVGLGKGAIKLDKPCWTKLIDDYTRESGVRELDKKIGKLVRRIVASEECRVKSEESDARGVEVKAGELQTYLGLAEYVHGETRAGNYAGVAMGLAWTATGGEVLLVETSVSPVKGGNLTLTGNLGNVMKESAMLALEYVRAHAETLGLDPSLFENRSLHVHVPEGAVPKDGPSAGITIATSIASALTGRKVRDRLAMTGELTLRGKVLPVGGIKEKILAAKRAGVTDIVLCRENERHIREIPEKYVKGVTFHYVNDVKEVFAIAGILPPSTTHQ